MTKYKTTFYIVGSLVLILGIRFVFFSPKNSEMGGGPMVPGAPKPPTAVTGNVVKGESLEQEIVSTGTIASNEEADLKAEISGKIVSLSIREGASVSKGTLLVKINDADLQAQLKKLNYQLVLAEEKEARQKKLLEVQGISKEEYDIAMNQVNIVKADIENLQAQIAKTEIRAPFDGVVGIRKVSEGSYVTPASSIVTIQQINPIKIDFSVPEKYVDKIRQGAKINFSIEGLEGVFSGNIYAVDPKIDVSTRTVQLRAIANNANGRIFPGSYAKVQWIMDKNSSALQVPTEAVVPVLKGQKVFLYKNGVAVEQKIETGVRGATKIEVTKGLNVGDTVVVTGIMTVRKDAPLKLIKVQ